MTDSPSAEAPDLASFRAAKQQLAREYLHPGPDVALPTPAPRANVVGVGIGEKTTGGCRTGQRALLMMVQHKYPLRDIAPANRLPRVVDGLPTDVRAVGTVRALSASRGAEPNPRAVHRPLRPGTSIGPDKAASQPGCGTFGALVQAGSQVYLLTAGHALGNYGAVEGVAVCQPATFDVADGTADVVATVARSLDLGALNAVDAAIAQLGPDVDAIPDTIRIGAPLGGGEAAVDDIVHKVGRTTGYTVGRVISVDTDVKVVYGAQSLIFQNQIALVTDGPEAFCDLGDSGSLVVHRRNRLGVGLLFAGAPGLGVATHLADVLDALGVELVVEPAVPPGHVDLSPAREEAPPRPRPSRHYTRLAP